MFHVSCNASFPSRLPARHQRLPRTAARPASAERRRGQLRRGHRLSATPHPPGNGKAGRARPGPGIGRRPATGLGPRFRLCRPTAQDQRQRAHRIPRRRPVQATDRQRDPATGRTRPTLSRRSAPGHLARVLRTLTLPCRPERGGSRDHFPPAAQPSVRPSWRTPAAPVRRTPELTRPTAGESIRCLAEQSAGNPGRPFQPWLRTGRRGHRAQHRKALRAAHARAPAGPFADDSLQLRQERPAPGATRPRL